MVDTELGAKDQKSESALEQNDEKPILLLNQSMVDTKLGAKDQKSESALEQNDEKPILLLNQSMAEINLEEINIIAK